MNKKPKTEHHMGQRTGYDVRSDGRILLAPVYSEQFAKASSERHGINDLMKLFTSHCADLLAEIRRRENHIWDEVCEDLGLDKENNIITFDGESISVTPKTPPESGADSSANPPQEGK